MTDEKSNPTRRHQQARFGLAVLFGLGQSKKHVYGGTIPHETKQHRRAANKVARKSRRINRRRGA